MPGRTQTLYADLAKALGLKALPADNNGGIQLSVGDTSTVILFAENDETLLLAAPVAALPKQPDYGVMLWLLRRNFYDSPIEPFRVSCDTEGNIILWGRLPMSGLTGAALAALIDAVATEADRVREEVADEEGA
jgi:Tir chaperone protein (CesT) family